MKEDRVFFPGLNGIRAIAAIIVLIFHTDQWSKYFGLEPYGFWNTRMQTYAVVLFFVLSGFLITYLLLKEKEKHGQITYNKFYLRRILRIWPVYYTVLFIGLTLLFLFPNLIDLGPKQNLLITTSLYTILLPNLAFFFGYSPDLIGILWSVGVEEQFYAFWPFLINKSKSVIKSLLLFLTAYLLLKCLALIGVFAFIPIDVNTLLFFLPFDCMAIGAIGAYLFYSKNSLLRVIYNPVIQICAWTFLLISIFYYPIHIPYLPVFDKDLHAGVYAVIILNVGTNPKTLITLENRVFNFLGKISYGIYAYHFIVLFLLSLVLRKFLPHMPSTVGHSIMFISELGATILVSYISYRYFESWFLKKKNQFMLIKSGNTKEKEKELQLNNKEIEFTKEKRRKL